MNYTIDKYVGRESGKGDWVRLGVTRDSFIKTLKRIIRATRRDGDGRRIRSTRQVFVTVKYGDNRTTAITFSLRGLDELFYESNGRYRAGISQGIDDTLAVIDEDRAEVTKKQAQIKRNARAKYNQYQSQTSGFDRFAGNTPRLYHCVACGYWFAKPSPPRHMEKPKCPSCHSTRVNRVR